MHTYTSVPPPADPMATPPGPQGRFWGLSLLAEMRADYTGFCTRLQRAHGDLTCMRLGNERAWDLMSPDLVREALVTHADHLIRWERGIDVFAQLFGRSVLVSEGAQWQQQRHMLMAAFTPRRVAGYAGLMTSAAREAFAAAIPPGESGALVNMDKLWGSVAMDVIVRTLFGTCAPQDAEAAIHATQVLASTAYREMFYPLTLPDWLPLPGKAAKRGALRTLRSLIQGHIDARRAGPADPAPGHDLLGHLLALRDAQTGRALTAQEVFDQCMVTFQAGYDTSSTALLWWSRLMAEHPHAADRARAEVLSVVGDGTPLPEHLPVLPWLTATLKEALRLYPPAAALLSRRTTAPITLGGWPVAAGDILRITPWVLHRDERWFAQADRFVPERFLPQAPPIPKGAWMPFGVGPRVCLGQHFAMLEMTLLAAMLLQRFRLSVPEGAPTCQPVYRVTLRPAAPVQLWLQHLPASPVQAPAV